MNVNLKKYLALRDIAHALCHNLATNETLDLDILHELIKLTSAVSDYFIKIVEDDECSSDLIRTHAYMMGSLNKLMNVAITEMEA